MVLGVCRRVAGDGHIAEDAFQAAFVVLARRAADVKPPGAVRPWLYGVAVRIAREARTMLAKRRAREVSVATLPDHGAEPVDPPDADALRLLDEEVGRLPDHLRAAVVLCELGGAGRKDAAGQLGIPEGTLSSRLGKARKLLAARLQARGVAVPAAGLAVLADALVPPRLLAQTSALATAARPLPAGVVALSDGVTRSMFLHKLTLAAAGGLLLVAVGGLALAGYPGADTPGSPKAEPPPAPKAAAAKPAVKGPNKLLYYKAGHPTLVDPDGKNEKRVAEDLGPGIRADARLSPDGKRVALIARLADPNDPPADPNKPIQKPGGRLYVVSTDGSGKPVDLAVDECRTLAWSPDGTEVVTTEFHHRPGIVPLPGRKEARALIAHTRVDIRTGNRTELDLPDGQLATDWSRDGRHFVTTAMGVEGGQETADVRLVSPDGAAEKKLTDPDELALLGRLSPDGKRLLYVRFDRKVRARELIVRDLAAGKAAVVEVPDLGAVVGYCWSPDGKRIAYTRHGLKIVEPDKVDWTLTVCDPDGKNATVIAKHQGPPQPLDTGGWVDWR
ncbi:MAG: hypothetical protein K2X82_25870 [Gemmataceae bacterium]|nr:hypothetical protein [Gemmataceae bacterium]